MLEPTKSPMSAQSPQEVHELFTKAMLAHDLDAVMATYDTDGVLVPLMGGAPVRGYDAIRTVNQKLIAMNPRDGALETVFCYERDDLAMTRSKWHFIADGPDGNPMEMSGSGAEVMRRKPDGSWVVLIDSPAGGNALP